ncbi:adenylate kinase, partial [bacterium]|nr:adenylate kinase [bacterium]
TNPKANGFIFKGFPRNLVQAYILDGMLRKMNSTVSKVINLEVPVLEAIKRLSIRAKTPNARKYDLNTDVILQRLEEFEKITFPVSEYYKKQNKFVTLSGLGTQNEIGARVIAEVEKTLREIR